MGKVRKPGQTAVVDVEALLCVFVGLGILDFGLEIVAETYDWASARQTLFFQGTALFVAWMFKRYV